MDLDDEELDATNLIHGVVSKARLLQVKCDLMEERSEWDDPNKWSFANDYATFTYALEYAIRLIDCLIEGKKIDYKNGGELKDE